jgi:nitrate reductase NapE component
MLPHLPQPKTADKSRWVTFLLITIYLLALIAITVG